MPQWLDRLEEWKHAHGRRDPAKLEKELTQVAHRRLDEPRDLIRLHETLLFLRAYPLAEGVARAAEDALDGFETRLDRLDDLTAFEEPEVSGIAGSMLSAVYSYQAARRLSARHGRAIDINWAECDNTNIGAALRPHLPLLAEDWPVEAHTPFAAWVKSALRRRENSLEWVLRHVREEREYDAMQLPLVWRMGRSRAARTYTRLPRRKLFLHDAPLLTRRDVSLESELDAPPLPVRPADPAVLDLIVDTSAVRFRELYGFNYPQTSRMSWIDMGRGQEMAFFGVPPTSRLPLRAYHAGMFFKNGVPAGYVEVLSLCERAEVGFNLYYTFREGESAWLYCRLLRVLRQMLGVTAFAVDPYQVGHENEEAIASGAFWFYRKLGFRPVEQPARRLLDREERRMAQQPGYRSTAATLRRLARSPMIYEHGPARRGDWDRFHFRQIGYRAKGRGMDELLPGWSRLEAAKRAPEETRYLRMTQTDPRVREALIRLGRF